MMERYRDLEQILFKGFIPKKVNIGGIDFVFKSLNDLEYDNVHIMSGLKGNPHYVSKFHLNYLFFSIYMINGINLLENRFSHYHEITETFKSFPYFIIKKIFNYLDDLTNKLGKCSNLVESYSFEPLSRYSWAAIKNVPLNSTSQTSILGTDILGLNQFQKYWVVLNIREDQKESFEEKYSLFKFLASFTDSKAVKKIEASDNARKEEEKERRKRIIATGTDEEKLYLSGETHTVSGLVSELNKQIKGEKDEHDKYIENYEKSLRENMLSQMQVMEKMRQERNKRSEDLLDQARPISREEMVERIRKNKEKSPINTFYEQTDSDMRSKFLQMSSVTNEDVIKENKMMSEEEYQKLINSDLFKAVHNPEQEKKDIEEEYKKQQKILAYKYGLDDDIEKELNFPHLRNK